MGIEALDVLEALDVVEGSSCWFCGGWEGCGKVFGDLFVDRNRAVVSLQAGWEFVDMLIC